MKILIPLDGTSRSEITLDWVPAFLEMPDAEAHLLHVAPSENTGSTRHTVGGKAVSCENYAEEAASRLPGRRIRTHTVVGSPALQIIRLAVGIKANVVAMRSRAKKGLSRVLMGSTTADVMETLQIPLLIVGPAVKKREETPAIRKILVPMDGSARSAAILPDIAWLAKGFNASVTLFHATTEDGPSRERTFQKHADDLSAQGIRAEVLMAIGKPAIEIVNQVLQPGFDLVAMSTRGRSGIQRLLLGSTAEEVVRTCPAPVLLKGTP